jgi:hypothetical protein
VSPLDPRPTSLEQADDAERESLKSHGRKVAGQASTGGREILVNDLDRPLELDGTAEDASANQCYSHCRRFPGVSSSGSLARICSCWTSQRT